MIEIYLDENLSEHVADALNFLNKGYFTDINVYSTKHKFGKGIADEDIIPAIGETAGILITRDSNIYTTRIQFQLCEKYKLGTFFLRPPKGSDKHWKIVSMLIENWDEIVSIIKKDALPFGYVI